MTDDTTEEPIANQDDDNEVEPFLHQADRPSDALIAGGKGEIVADPVEAEVEQAEVEQAEIEQAEIEQAEVEQAEVEQAGASLREERNVRLLAQEAASTTTVSRQEYVSRTRRSVLTGAAAVAAGGLAWGGLLRQAEDGNIPAFLRQGFATNEAIWERLYDPGRLAPEFAASQAEEIRVNGTIGLNSQVNLDTWSMDIVDAGGSTVDTVDMDSIRDLPTVDMVVEHKCIEGWSNIVQWTGVRFADFATRYEGLIASTAYVSLETPDGNYYVGLDMDTVMHPQSLLAFAWNGQMLTQERGAPLRLVTPLHYGIKMLKRIGRIQFTTTRPADYWAERGYDWDSSH